MRDMAAAPTVTMSDCSAASRLWSVVAKMGGALTANRGPRPQGVEVAETSQTLRRRLRCGRVPGVLTRSGGRWLLSNVAEVRTSTALGGDDGTALDLFAALVAALNEGVVHESDLRVVHGRLAAILRCDEDKLVRLHVSEKHLGAVAFVCVCLSHPSHTNAHRWLAWVLSARLERNLIRRGLPGPGLWSVRGNYQQRETGFDQSTLWIDAMPAGFWQRLRSHHIEWLSDAAMASNPRSTPRVLRKLAQSNNRVVADLVASHPRTPPRVLARLSESYVVDSFRVAQNLSASRRLLSRLADHPDVWTRQIVAVHPSTPAETLEELADDDDAQVRAQAASRGSVSDLARRRLARDVSGAVRRAVAISKHTPVDLLEHLLEDPISAVRCAAVSNSKLFSYTFDKLAGDRSVHVRSWVAHRSSGQMTLTQLAKDPKTAVRALVAENCDTSKATLQTLARDPDGNVRAAVAANERTPAAQLAELVVDPEPWVRASVAKNPKASRELLTKLLDTKNWTVESCLAESCLAENPAAPADLLESVLSSDPSEWPYALVDNPSIPAAMLQQLAASDDPWTRERAAANPSASPRLLAELAADEQPAVRLVAARQISQRGERPAASRRLDLWFRDWLRYGSGFRIR